MVRSRTPPAEVRKTVGIWIRVSTEDQARGEAPEHHEHRARMYAETRGWDVVEVYDLAGVSGKSVVKHPEAQRMLTDVKSGHITGLVVSKLARLTRNTREFLDLADYFERYGTDLISLQEALDTSTPAGRLFSTMVAGMAQWEREEIADRVAASVQVRAKLGKSLGGIAPYGYRWEQKRLVLDPVEAPIRRRLFELFLEHRRKRTVARLLNEAGYRTRTGQRFTDTTVHRLLVDPIAKGSRRVNFTRSRTSRAGKGYKPPSEWVYVAVEPIVPEEVWEQANAILQTQIRDPKKRPAKRVRHVFAGIVYCRCGHKMYVPAKGRSYICQTKGCRNRIGIEDLSVVFQSQLKHFFFSSDQLRQHLERADERVSAVSVLVASLESERAKVAAEMEKLYRLYLDGHLPGHRFAERNAPLEERLQALETELPERQGELDFLKVQLASSSDIIEEAQDLCSRWEQMDGAARRRMVEQVASRIEVGLTEVKIKLAYLPDPKGRGQQANPPPEPEFGAERRLLAPPPSLLESRTKRQRTLNEALQLTRLRSGTHRQHSSRLRPCS